MAFIQFPERFEWGAATAAYQIEGAPFEDGKGASIWDTFCREPGRIQAGQSGEVACDHYHRWRDDVSLMRELGLQTYRFSISWARVLPLGQGKVNAPGIAFYDRLVDGLLEGGIAPCVTLYHWDLPQALQDRGGWAERDVVDRFADYAQIVFERLGDRVQRWITHNEPAVTAMAGHRLGVLAPGTRDLGVAARVIHHLLMSHGRAVQVFRSCRPAGEIGIAHANTHYEALDDTPENALALERARDFGTRLWHDPIFRRGYPQSVLEYYASKGAPLPVEPGDLETIAEPIDFLGVNLYSRAVVRRDPRRGVGFRECAPTLSTTPMGYEIAPYALGQFVRFVSLEYGRPRIYVTENGMCDNTPLVAGVCDDQPRIALLRGMIAGLGSAIAEGVADVGAYYVWSLIDNFEWAYGYSKRFGIVWTDFETLERIPKASARFFSDVIRRNGVEW